MLKVYLVRHGETEWNVAKCIQGQSDSPLTKVGIKQAKLVAKRIQSIGITHILSSDLERTKKTAEIIAKFCHCDVIFEPRLRELNMGVLEGRPMNSLNDEEESWCYNLVNGLPGARIPKGESMEEITERMFSTLEECRLLPVNSKPLLVSHGIGLGALLNYILGVPLNAQRRLRLRNCSLSKVDYQKRPWLQYAWILETAGDISHLKE
ncbi:MAG: 2,3-diphosphoglycerate-dependent phosphoglycerate mutase GpmB [Arsenophonus sp.]|nr:MAG: 2,3-diphosphoglycerate-dependent phosphoglycerate mutase GpmB [Arsenophonus sp.]